MQDGGCELVVISNENRQEGMDYDAEELYDLRFLRELSQQSLL